jgi:hypothetical protein
MLNTATLQAIRRKVDKATKRADEVQREVQGVLDFGDMRDAIKMLVGTAQHEWGEQHIYRGDYSLCYPASVGPTTNYMVFPQIVCLNADEARHVANTSAGPNLARQWDERVYGAAV